MLTRLLLVAAGLTVAQATASSHQSAPDLFTCIQADRLAFGTTTYDFPLLDSSLKATTTIAPVEEAGQRLIRITFKTLPTVDQITDLDAGTLAPRRVRLVMSGKTGVDLARAGAEIRGFRDSSATPFAVATGASPILFGGAYTAEFLAAAVAWERCPSVTARYLFQYKPTDIVMTRTGSATLTHAGVGVEVWEIAIARAGQQQTDRVWVTKTPPHYTRQFSTPDGKLVRFLSRDPR